MRTSPLPARVFRILMAAAVVLVCLATGLILFPRHASTPSALGPPRLTHASGAPSAPSHDTQPSSRRAASAAFDKRAHSTTNPSSIWVIVNKSHPITPSSFRPEIALVRGYQVARPAARPLERMLEAAQRAGVAFKIASAFRSYDYQVRVHGNLVATSGEAAADQVSARPGYSEHQTGLAVDLITPEDPRCDFEPCFAGAPGGRWLAGHAWRFGFIVRYTTGTRAVTGYAPEPWHLRFVGRALAAELRRTHVSTLERFFGVSGGDYPAG